MFRGGTRLPEIRAPGDCQRVTPRRLTQVFVLFLSCVMPLHGSARAASDTWTGGLSTSYTTPGNWAGGTVPDGAADVATFQSTGTVRTAVVAPAAPVSIDSFTFNSGAPAFGFTLGASSDLSFVGQGLVNNSTSTQTFTVGSVAGPNAFLRFINNASAGTRTAIVANTFGNVIFQDNASGGSAAFTANTGGTIDFSGLTSAGTTAGSLAGAGSYILGNTSLTTGSLNTSTTVSGVISGVGGSLQKVGTGTFTLSGANTYSGGTTLTAGNLVTSHDSALGTGALTLGGGTLQAGGASPRTLANDITVTANSAIGGSASPDLILNGSVALNAGTLTVSKLGYTTLAGIISGGGNLTKSGTGTLTLSEANTYTGNTRVTGGILNAVGGANRLGTIGIVYIYSPGAINLNHNDQTFANLQGTGTLTDIGALAVNTGSFSGIISGTGSLTKNTTGSLTLSGANTFSGGTTVNAGTLVAGNDSALGSGALTLSGGALQASGTSPRTLANDITVTANSAISGTASLDLILNGTVDLDAGSTLSVSRSSNTTLAGIISGAGALAKSGNGTLLVSPDNTYSGGTTLTAGTLIAGSDTALGSGALTLSGGTLQASGTRILDNSVTVGGNFTIGGGTTDNLTLKGPVNLGTAGRTITVSSLGSTTLAGVVSGSGLFTKAGTGTLTLSEANTYTGGLRVTGGTVSAVGGADRLSTVGTTTITSPGSVNLNHNDQTFANLQGTGTLTDIGALAVNAGTFSGVISGTGSLTKNTTGTLTLSGANTYSGGATLNAGTLVAGSDTALGSGLLTINGGTLQASGTRTLANTVNVGGNFTIAGGSTANLTLSGPVDLLGGSRTLTVSSTNPTTLAGIISNGALAKAGTGTLTLTEANTYSGGTTLTAGNLVAGHDSALGSGALTLGGGTLQAGGASPLTLANDITVTANSAIGGAASPDLTLTGTVAINSGRTLTVSKLDNTTLAGIISGAGALAKTGTGTLTLSGANTYTGNTSVTGGILSAVGGANRLSTVGTTTITSPGSVNLNNNAQTLANLQGSGTLADIGALTVNAGNFSGVISGTGSLTKNTTGTLILSGANTYSGDTTVNGGTLRATGGDNRLSTTGITTINAGATLDLTGTNQTFATLNGPGTLSNIGATTIGAGAFSGVISGTGSLIKDTTGTLTLSGANSYNGGTTLTGGTLIAGSNTALGSGTLALNGGILQASGTRTLGNSVTVGGDFAIDGTGNLSLGGGVDLLGGSRTITVTSTGSSTLSGIVSNGSLTKAGAGTLTLSGANTYAGDTTVTGGTLQATGGDNRLSTTGITTVDAGATLDLTATNQSFATLNGAGTLSNIGTTTIGAGAFSGIITGAGSLTKNTSGTLTLSGANTYTGSTQVLGGALQLTGSLMSPVSVASGAVISGTGSTAGSLTLDPGAIYAASVAPWLPSGSRVGLWVGGNVVLNNNTVQITAAGSAGQYWPQRCFDLLVYSGTATGSFGPVMTDLAFLSPEIIPDPAQHKFILQMLPSVNGGGLFASVTQTSNQWAVAQALDRALAAGALSDTMAPLWNMTAPQARDALRQMAGDVCAVPVRSVFQSLSTFIAGIHTRIHDGAGATDLRHSLTATSLLGGAPGGAASRGGRSSRLLPALADLVGIMAVGGKGEGDSAGLFSRWFGIPETAGSRQRPGSTAGVATHGGNRPREGPDWRQGLWGTLIGQEDRLKSDSFLGSAGARIRTGGVQVGFDRRFGNTRLGVAASYSDSTAHFDASLGQARSRGGLAALYGKYDGTWRNWYTHLGVGYGLYRNHLQRHLAFLTPALQTSGRFRADVLTGFGEAGFDLLRVKTVAVQPFAGFLAADVLTSGFTEAGAGPFNLHVARDTQRTRQITAGLRLVKEGATINCCSYRLDLEVAWRHEFSDRSAPVNAAFAVDPGYRFTSVGTPRSANSLLASAGARIELGKGFYGTGRLAFSQDSRHSSAASMLGLQKTW